MYAIKRYFSYMPVILILFFILLLLISPESGRSGAGYGLLLCGKVIIPSLFPFAVCVLFIMRSGILGIFKKIEPVTQFVFGQSSDEFVAFLLSLVGGYPVGGRLIKELYDNGQTDRRRAHILECCSTNAGPAFIVIAVGSSILGSKELGYILLLASTLSSITLAVLCGFLLKRENSIKCPKKSLAIPLADNFVSSTADAAASVFGICGYVILFAVINAYLDKSSFVGVFRYLTEVTSAVTLTKNIYLIAFLIGFSGLCVWFQLFSVAGDLGVSLPIFALSRLLHGAFSALFTYLATLIFKPSIQTITNNTSFDGYLVVETPALGFALIAMGILFCISLFSKNKGRNFLHDVI